VFEAEHGGLENQAKVRVIGGGSKVETIGLSLQDAQYVESMQLSIDALANIYGVPASLLGGGNKQTGATPITPEHEQMRWFEYGLEPRLARIVATVNSDPDFFGPGARDYVTFTGVTVRADTAAESRARRGPRVEGIAAVAWRCWRDRAGHARWWGAEPEPRYDAGGGAGGHRSIGGTE
jgi:hypothetical protein